MKIHQHSLPYRQNEKNIIISSDADKICDKIQNLFVRKVLETTVTQAPYLNTIKEIYSKPIVKLNGEKLKAFPLNYKKDKAVHSLPLSSI